jgi:hypothetical protein
VPRGVVDLSGRIKTEKENDQKAEDWRYVHGFSITDGKSPKRGWRAERRAAGLRQQTKKKGSNPNFGPFDSTSFQSLRGYRDGPARAPNAISTVPNRIAELP